MQWLPDRIDYDLHIVFIEGWSACLYQSKFGDQDIAIDPEPLVVHDLLGARDRTTVNDDSFIGSFTNADQFFYPPANTGKAGTPAISFARQLTRGCIGELTDIRSDSGAGVDDPCFPFVSATAR
jgi:hypothetical protein